jgi:hypothetical protein
MTICPFSSRALGLPVAADCSSALTPLLESLSSRLLCPNQILIRAALRAPYPSIPSTPPQATGAGRSESNHRRRRRCRDLYSPGKDVSIIRSLCIGGGQRWLKFRVVAPRTRMTASSTSCSLPPINRIAAIDHKSLQRRHLRSSPSTPLGPRRATSSLWHKDGRVRQ